MQLNNFQWVGKEAQTAQPLLVLLLPQKGGSFVHLLQRRSIALLYLSRCKCQGLLQPHRTLKWKAGCCYQNLSWNQFSCVPTIRARRPMGDGLSGYWAPLATQNRAELLEWLSHLPGRSHMTLWASVLAYAFASTGDRMNSDSGDFWVYSRPLAPVCTAAQCHLHLLTAAPCLATSSAS